MDLKVQDKSALISGSTKGIGFAIAALLAAEGGRVIFERKVFEEIDDAEWQRFFDINRLQSALVGHQRCGAARGWGRGARLLLSVISAGQSGGEKAEVAVNDERLETVQEIGSAFARTRPPEPSAAMPAQPTLFDIFNLRLNTPKFGLPIAAAPHCVQSASLALKAGMDEETVLACLLHDIGLAVVRPDHGWWGAQLVEPYVSEKVSWAIRYHQALRYYPDESVGYQYPQMYVKMFGEDYRPPEYIAAAHQYARNHKWYMHARNITLFDDYSFDKSATWSIEPYTDIIGRHFRQPKEGLGNDASATAHMWRTLIDPSKPL